MKRRHIIYHDLSTAKGREAFNKAYRAKHGLDEPPKTTALPPRIVFKELLPAERGKLGVCPSTRLEAFKATPFPGSFKLGPRQRLHRWLCDECGFWHGQVVNPEDNNPPLDEPTYETKAEGKWIPMPPERWDKGTFRVPAKAKRLFDEHQTPTITINVKRKKK